MKQAIVIVSMLLIASAAQAQWEFELSNPVLSPSNPSTTVTLSIAPPPGDWAFARAHLDVHAAEPGWSDLEPLIPLPGQNPGHISGASVLDMHLVQFSDFGPRPWAPTPGRLDVWQATFTVTDFEQRQIELRSETSGFYVYTLPWDPIAGSPTEARVAVEGSSMIRVIPAPAGLALLALGGVDASRRRRRPQIRRSAR